MSIQIRDELGDVVGDTTMWSQRNNGSRNTTFSESRVVAPTKEQNTTWGREARTTSEGVVDSPWNLSLERLQSVQYPLNGGNGKHSIKFYINISEESKLITKGQVDALPSDDRTRSLQNRSDAVGGDIKSISNLVTIGGIAFGASLTGSALMKLVRGGVALTKPALYGGTALGAVAIGDQAGYSTENGIADYLKVTSKIKKLTSTITLYSPANIKTDYSFNYDSDRNVLADLMTQEGSNDITEGLKALGGAASAVPRIVAVAANSTIGLLSKTAINPKQTMMFKEVAPRTFQFEYRFAPRSKEEAIEISKIIRAFKVYAHPEMIEGFANFLYIYPAEFDIEYHYQDESGNSVINKNLNKISSCYLEKIDVRYGEGGSYQSLANGEPLITDMTLIFREIERLHRDRIMEGY